jgi:hypothetical protein
MSDLTYEIIEQIKALDEEQMRIKVWLNSSNFNVTTAPYVIAKKYRDEIKAHIKLLRMNVESSNGISH